jgi:hypothetical protein
MSSLELLEGFEPSTSSLPRTCSTTELQQRKPAATREGISSSFDKKTEVQDTQDIGLG